MPALAVRRKRRASSTDSVTPIVAAGAVALAAGYMLLRQSNSPILDGLTVPPVPSGKDATHNNQDVLNYGAWLQNRIEAFDRVFGAVNGIDLPALMGQGTVSAGLQALTNMTQSTQPKAAALVPAWVTFRHGWDAFHTQLPNDIGWSAAATDFLESILTMGASNVVKGGSEWSGTGDPWSQLKAWHAQLIEWALKMASAGLTPPALPGLPGATGGASSGTVAFFSLGVGALGAYLGWQLFPSPLLAASTGAMGAGATYLALR